MLASQPATILALLYALVCAVLIIPSDVWGRGPLYVVGYFVGSVAAWAVMAALVAGILALIARAELRRSRAFAAFNVALCFIATVNLVARTHLFTS